jgi:hypothetical protein
MFTARVATAISMVLVLNSAAPAGAQPPAGVLLPAAPLEHTQPTGPTILPPSTAWPAAPLAPVETTTYWDAPVIGPPAPCAEAIYRNSAWKLELQLIPTQSHLTRAPFGSWPDDDQELAVRINLGHENARGHGVRFQFWRFHQNAEAFSDNVELTAYTVNLDLYKKLFLEDSELLLGAGPTFSGMEFDLGDGDELNFDGSGMTVVAEGWFPLVRFEKTDFGSVGRARMSLLLGRWDDDSTMLVPETDHDSLSIFEVAWGVEVRRRFGRRQDKHWFLSTLIEHQRWQSDWTASFMGTSVAFTGASINSGIAW